MQTGRIIVNTRNMVYPIPMLQNLSPREFLKMLLLAMKSMDSQDPRWEELEREIQGKLTQGSTVDRPSWDQLWVSIRRINHRVESGWDLGRAMALYFRNHLLFLVMKNSPDLDAALKKFIRYHGILSSHALPVVNSRGSRTEITLGFQDRQDNFMKLATLAFFCYALYFIGEETWLPQEIFLSREMAKENIQLEELQGATLISHRDCFGMGFPTASIRSPLVQADPELQKSLEDLLQRRINKTKGRETWKERCARYTEEELLAGEVPSLVGWADRQGRSPRTLQNYLQKEATSFRKIGDQVRAALATKAILEERMSLVDLAFLLGFSEQSAFNHAFKKWTGYSPGQYKARQEKEESP